MSSSSDRWLHNDSNHKKTTDDRLEFDLSLFNLHPDTRKRIFGIDPVEELKQMSPNERINRYGRDYSEYF
jgi:hypothetical protein